MATTSRPVLIAMSVLAGAQVLTGGAVLSDVIGSTPAGLAVLSVAAIQAGIAFYVQGLVTPNASVVATKSPGGGVIAGPAAPGDITEGTQLVVHEVP